MKVHRCLVCDQRFGQYDKLQEHRRSHHSQEDYEAKRRRQETVFQCSECNYTSTRSFNLRRHYEKCHENTYLPTEKCHICQELFTKSSDLVEHYKSVHKSMETKFQIRKQALNGATKIMTQAINLPLSSRDLLRGKYFNSIVSELETHLTVHYYYKVSLTAYASFLPNYYVNEDEMEDQKQMMVLSTTAKPIFRGSKCRKVVHNLIQELINREDDLTIEGSGHSLQDILSVDINFTKCGGLSYGCGFDFNPKTIKNASKLLHIPNRDDYCITYVIAASYWRKKVKNPSDPKSYVKFIKKLNIEGVNFPSNLVDIEKLVSNNKWLDCQINVFSSFQNQLFAIGLGIGKGRHIINILALDYVDGRKSENRDAVGHYFLIKDIDGFLTQIYDSRRYYTRKWCLSCLKGFSSEETLANHKPHCLNKGLQLEKYPIEDKNDTLEFKNLLNQYKHEIIILYDFECFIDPETGEHRPFAYSFVVVDMNRKIIKEECQVDPSGNAHIKFIKRLLSLEDSLVERASRNLDMPEMTSREKFRLRNKATHCNHCFEAFQPSDIRTIDHCHYSGTSFFLMKTNS